MNKALSEFLDGNVYVKLTNEDIPRLDIFEKTIGHRKWASGELINSNYTKGKLNVHPIYFICTKDGIQFLSFDPVNYCILDDILEEEINMDDMISIFE